jgi:hypothetical protein
LLPDGSGQEQTEAQRFATLRAAQHEVAPIAGPFNAILREAVGALILSWADVNVADFHASATVTVPEQQSAVPWDTGFRFRGDERVTISARGIWSYSVGVEAAAATGPVPNLVTTPGAVNTLDLLVAGERAWLGVNGVFVASFALTPGGAAGDVEIGVGFFTDEVADGRATAFRDFLVRPLEPGSLGPPPATNGNAGSLPVNFVGRWEGTATWDGAPLPVTLDLMGGSTGEIVGRVEYALYGDTAPRCGGDLALDEVAAGGDSIALTGTITYDSAVCLVEATVTATLSSDGTFRYEWHHPLLDVTGAGTLERASRGEEPSS